VNLVSDHQLEELALRLPHGVDIRLGIHLHPRTDVLVAHRARTVFGSIVIFTSAVASECLKLWNPKRAFQSAPITPTLTAAGRQVLLHHDRS
jgi:hypothetical protein